MPLMHSDCWRRCLFESIGMSSYCDPAAEPWLDRPAEHHLLSMPVSALLSSSLYSMASCCFLYTHDIHNDLTSSALIMDKLKMWHFIESRIVLMVRMRWLSGP